VYFVTDGSPLPFREFLTALLETQGVPAPHRTLPGWALRGLATVAGFGWQVLPLPGEPPIDPAALRAIGEECTVRDDKARRELGYEGQVTREQGLAELRSDLDHVQERGR
jgi:nucleoside-diphosphate-sugar epimerase